MKLTQTQTGYTFQKEDGTEVELTYREINFLDYELTKADWKNGIEDEIDEEEENIDFDIMNRDELIKLCMADLEEKYEDGMLDDAPDYESILFDVAQENGVWKE